MQVIQQFHAKQTTNNKNAEGVTLLTVFLWGKNTFTWGKAPRVLFSRHLLVLGNNKKAKISQLVTNIPYKQPPGGNPR